MVLYCPEIGFQNKNKVRLFEDFFIIIFQNIEFTKEFLECINYILGNLPKLNRGLGQVIGTHFQNIFQ